MSDLFSILAAIGLAASVTKYFFQVVQGTSTPNTATWLITVVVMSINSLTYLEVAGSIKALSIITINVGIVVIFVYSLFKGKFTRINRTDMACLALAVIIGTIWQITNNAKLATVMLQGITPISMWPILSGLLKGRLREHPAAWDIAVISYVFLLVAIVLDWNSQHWTAVALPLFSGIMGNGSVAILAHLQKKGKLAPVIMESTHTP